MHNYYAQPICYTYVSKWCESLTDWSIPLSKWRARAVSWWPQHVTLRMGGGREDIVVDECLVHHQTDIAGYNKSYSGAAYRLRHNDTQRVGFVTTRRFDVKGVCQLVCPESAENKFVMGSLLSRTWES